MQNSGQPPTVGMDTMSPNQAPGYARLDTPGQSVKPQWYQNYKTKASIGLGIAQIIMGAMLIILNTVTIVTYTGYYSVGQGFWSGVLVIIAGVFAILAGKYPNSCYIIASLVLSAIAASLAGISILVSGLSFTGYYRGITSIVLISLMLVVSVTGCVLSIIISAFSCKVLCAGQGNNYPSGLTTAMPRPDMAQEPSSKRSVGMIILGCVQCFNGLTCVAFGIFSLVVKSSTSVAGHGFWCGLVVIAHGIIAILFARRNSRPLMIAQLMLAITVCVLAIAAFCIALVGMAKSEEMRRSELPLLPQSPQPYNNKLRIKQIVMDCILVVVTLCALCCGIWGSILSCLGSMKCCQPNIYKQQLTYSATSAKFAGVGQFVVGAMCWAFAAASITLQSYRTSSGSGLDAGTMFMISGIFGYMSGVQKRKPWIVAAMVLAIISSLFVVSLMVHGILGINMTHGGCNDGYRPYYYYYGSCYQRAAQYAVHAMHIMLGVAQLVFLLWSSGIACKLCCCSQPGFEDDVLQAPTVMYSQSPQQQQQPLLPGQAQVFFYQNGQLIPAHMIGPNQAMVLAPFQTGAPPADERTTQPATPPPAYDCHNFEKQPLPE